MCYYSVLTERNYCKWCTIYQYLGLLKIINLFLAIIIFLLCQLVQDFNFLPLFYLTIITGQYDCM